MKDTLKRLLSLLLVCAMMVSLVVSVFATDGDQGELPEAELETENEVIVEDEMSDAALLAAAPTGENMTAAGMKIISKTANSVAPGVTYDKLIIRNASNQQNMGILTKVNLGQSVTIKASYNGYYTAGSTAETRAAASKNLKWGFQSTTGQAAAYGSISDPAGTVVMATNADYFNMGTGEPSGYLIMEGNEIKTTGEPYFAILKDGTAVIRDAGVDHSDVVEAISGPFYLVKDGKNVAPADYGQMPRNSIGICDDGSIVFFQNDGRQAPKSVGMTLPEMAAVLLDAGCHTALYMDGGGSATVAARKEGATSLEIVNSPSDGQERDVSSAILIVSTAKATGEFDHAAITPNDELYTPNSQIQFSATGVDSAGTAVEIPSDVTWALTDDSIDMGTIDENGLFTANEKTGMVTVEMRQGDKCVGSAFVEIVTPDHIGFANEEISLGFEDVTDFGISVQYQERDVNYKVGDIIWTTTNEKMGTFDGNLFTASDGESLNGEVTATSAYNTEVKGTIKVIVGMLPTVVWDFEDVVNEDGTVTDAAEYYVKDNGGSGILYSSNYGRGGKQSIEIISIDDGEPVRFGEKAMKLNYDFTQCGTDTEGAVVGTDAGYEIPGVPTAIGVWVYAPEGVGIEYKGPGTQAGFWLRGYGTDANGNQFQFNFVPEPAGVIDQSGQWTGEQAGIYWEGWMYLEAKIPANNPAPYKLATGNALRLMYVAGTGMGTKTANALYFDNFQFVYGTNVDDIDNPKVDSITIANKELEDGAELTTNKISLRTTFSDVQNKYTSGVDASTVRMYIDGVNVVDNEHYNFALNANDGYAELYDLELLDGQHSVMVSLRDKFGNETSETRFFSVKAGSAAPAVTVDPVEDSAILGDKVILEVRATEAGITKMENTIRLSNRFPAPVVTFADGYAGTYSYNKTTNTLSISAELKPDAPDTAAEESTLIATISVDVPADLTENDSFLYEIKSGSYTTAEDKFYTYSAGEVTLPVDAEVVVSCDPILVGGPNGVLEITDRDGKPVAGAKIYLASDNTEIGTADENGLWETDYFSTAAAKVTVYAKNANGMPSFHYNVFSYEGSGAVDEAPSKIQFNAVNDSSSQKNISWLSNPLAEGVQSIRYRAEGTEEWTTKEAESKLLTFATGGNVAANINSIILTGLNAGTTYEYQVGAGELWSEIATMKTIEVSSDTKFFVMSDVQADDLTNVKALVGNIKKGSYQFGVQTGDSIDNVTSYTQVANAVDLLGKDILGDMNMIRVLGNHEYYGDPDAEIASALYGFADAKPGSCYSVTVGDVYVAVINYTADLDSLNAAAEWLKQDAKNSNATWKVLAMHQPPYYTNANGGNAPINALIPGACEEAGIDVVFSGHDHALARTNQLTGGEIDEENGILYYIGGSSGEKSYAVNSQDIFDYEKIFALATTDFDATYIGIEANKLRMTLNIYDVAADGTATVRDTYTLYTATGNCDKAGHELDEAVYDRANKTVICNNCGMAVDAVAYDYTDWATDKETGRKMYLISGEPQTGEFIFGEETYYFDENGVAYQGKVELDEVELEFENGQIVGGYTGFVKKTDGNLYHYVDGAMTHGWLEADGDWYYMSQKTGAALVGECIIPDDSEALFRNTRYDFAEDGRLVGAYFGRHGYYYWAGEPVIEGWVKEASDPDPDAWYATNTIGHFITDGSDNPTVKYTMPDGVVYTFDNSNGKLLQGGFAYKDGKVYFCWAGVPVNDGWFELDGKTYYAFENGELATGSHVIDDVAYMFNSKGELVEDGVILTVVPNKDNTKVTVTVSGAEDVDAMSLAIWPANGNQDLTLEWFDAELNKDKEWVAEVPLCIYNRADTYNVHAHVMTDGESSVIVNSTFVVEEAVEHNYKNEYCTICGAIEEKEITVYRLYNPYTLEHLLTADPAERDMLLNVGWELDGIAWSSPNSGQPVYRLYNPFDDWHTYTMSQEEIDTLVPLGWKVDGVVCYSAKPKDGRVVYRLYNPYEKKNYHLLTASEEERAFLEAAGWKFDGGAWYCLAD